MAVTEGEWADGVEADEVGLDKGHSGAHDEHAHFGEVGQEISG